jgi:NAD(P)-dependent dehydrogenase (short-subunit alcohol dehydrogenase family)
MTSITGRVALVTGGGSGIGRGLALALAAEQCPVIVADIAVDRAADVADRIIGSGGSAAAICCDVSDRASVAALKAEAERTLGLPTLLFANAGVTSFDPLEKMTSRDIDWVIQVNLMGVVNCVEAFLPHMLSVRGGHIVGTSSTAGLIPSRIPHHVPYAAAKMGVIALMLNLHADYFKDGVGCTVLVPGGVPSRMLECPTVRPQRFGGPGAPIQLQRDIAGENAIAFREPEEVAQMVLRGIRNNRPMVLTDGTRRHYWQTLYADIVTQAFDDVEAFVDEKSRSAP